jgi:mannose-6-phosphate isomerase-like protein (cupin superfamily)
MTATSITRQDGETAPLPPGRLSALLLQRGSMSLRWYAPKPTDPQTPHDQDELYIVVSGTGTFVRGDERVAFNPHDVLFAAAGESHRFEAFSPDFATWVVFYGAVGGESP